MVVSHEQLFNSNPHRRIDDEWETCSRLTSKAATRINVFPGPQRSRVCCHVLASTQNHN